MEAVLLRKQRMTDTLSNGQRLGYTLLSGLKMGDKPAIGQEIGYILLYGKER